MRFLFLIATLLTLLGIPPQVRAQTGQNRQATKKQLKQLREQISEGEKRLTETQKREQASLKTLENLERRITVRKELINNYKKRRTQLSTKLDSIQKSSARLQRRVNGLRNEYKKRAIHAYRHGRLQDLALILSAKSINQMLVRARYLHRFTNQRKDRLDEIRVATRDLEQRQKRLQQTEQQLDSLITQAQSQRDNLRGLQEDRQEVISNLRNKKDALQTDLDKKRKSASKLEQRVREMMAAERRRRSNESAASRARFKQLSGSFANNRGRLPWPSVGVVTEPYGEVTNPVYGTKTPNPGILISTKPSAPVKAIFKGRVFKVFTMPDFGTCLALSHGAYSSVYCNVSLAYVSEGQQIEAGATIGRAGTKSSPKGSGVFFGLYNKEQSIDPAKWLAKK